MFLLPTRTQFCIFFFFFFWLGTSVTTNLLVASVTTDLCFPLLASFFFCCTFFLSVSLHLVGFFFTCWLFNFACVSFLFRFRVILDCFQTSATISHLSEFQNWLVDTSKNTKVPVLQLTSSVQGS